MIVIGRSRSRRRYEKEKKCTLPQPRLLTAARRVQRPDIPLVSMDPERQTENNTEETSLPMPLDEEIKSLLLKTTPFLLRLRSHLWSQLLHSDSFEVFDGLYDVVEPRNRTQDAALHLYRLDRAVMQ